MKKHAQPSAGHGTSQTGSAEQLSGGAQPGAQVANSESGSGSWLSKAWNGVASAGGRAWDATKSRGESILDGMMNGARNVGTVGAGVGALPGGLVGAGVGGLAGGVLNGKEGAKKGANYAGKALALPGALVGGVVGGAVGAVSGLVDGMTYDEEELLAQTADIPAYHVIVEQLAHKYAYGAGDEATLESWGYEIAAEHEDSSSGFRVISFSAMNGAMDPDGKPLKPVVAFRGTANAGGALDDVNNQGVGTFQFSRNEKEIEQVASAAQGPTKPDSTGHSLGGALAQLAVARFPGLFSNIVTFQAAGINGTEAQRIDSEEHEATHYRTGGDLVHAGGETFARGEVIQLNTKGFDTALSHMTFPLAELNALRGKTEADVPVVKGARSDRDTWVADEGGGHHEGHWASEESEARSNLHSVERHEDVDDGSTADVLEMIGGRKTAAKAWGLLGKTGVASRQQDYAKAWREIRAVAMTVKTQDEVVDVRKRIVDMVIDLGVDPRDHGKFISQAEAAMIDALAGKNAAKMA